VEVVCAVAVAEAEEEEEEEKEEEAERGPSRRPEGRFVGSARTNFG